MNPPHGGQCDRDGKQDRRKETVDPIEQGNDDEEAQGEEQPQGSCCHQQYLRYATLWHRILPVFRHLLPTVHTGGPNG